MQIVLFKCIIVRGWCLPHRTNISTMRNGVALTQDVDHAQNHPGVLLGAPPVLHIGSASLGIVLKKDPLYSGIVILSHPLFHQRSGAGSAEMWVGDDQMLQRLGSLRTGQLTLLLDVVDPPHIIIPGLWITAPEPFSQVAFATAR